MVGVSVVVTSLTNVVSSSFMVGESVARIDTVASSVIVGVSVVVTSLTNVVLHYPSWLEYQ